MTTQEKQRIDGEKIVNLIANSFFEDMYSWTQAKAINCYAFARGLTWLVNWIEYGKTFQFNTVGRELGSSFTECDESVLIPCEAVCFENFFYKLELPEDWVILFF